MQSSMVKPKMPRTWFMVTHLEEGEGEGNTQLWEISHKNGIIPKEKAPGGVPSLWPHKGLRTELQH